MQKHIDMASCGMVPRKRPKRAARVEWEHVMPAWEMGHQLQCWHRQGKYSGWMSVTNVFVLIVDQRMVRLCRGSIDCDEGR